MSNSRTTLPADAKTACQLTYEMLKKDPTIGGDQAMTLLSACRLGLFVSPLSKSKNVLFTTADNYKNEAQAKAKGDDWVKPCHRR